MWLTELFALVVIVAVVFGTRDEIGHPCPECYMFNIQQRMRNEVKITNPKVRKAAVHI